jgi:hypothetical protein
MRLSAEPTHSAPLSAPLRAPRLWIEPVSVFAIAAGLIVLRAGVYLLFEQFGLDSDQAINGLMAKHLSEGRAFPLFFYGQTYMLAVESWVAVPFFWIGGATAAMLRASLVSWNIAFAVLLIVGLHRDAGLRWWTALVPALFFLIAPPSLGKQLVEAQGGDIEPFVYVAALWFVRRRPLWFGVILGIGFRNREFTMYAVPVLLAIELAAGELTRSRLRDWLLALVMFLAVSEGISALMPFADLAGPGTRGQLLRGFAVSQLDNLVGRFNWRPADLVTRTVKLVPDLLGWFTGAVQVDTRLAVSDHHWLLPTAALLMAAGAARLVWLVIPRRGPGRVWRASIEAMRTSLARSSFACYILGVGLVSAITFISAKPTLVGYSRYALLGSLVPVGLCAALLTLESNVVVRRVVTCVVVAWAALAATDNSLLLVRTVRQPPPNQIRELAETLIARHVPVATGWYWDAYVTAFVAHERVLVTSSNFMRIQQYEDALADHLSDARLISRQPCAGGERVARWYLCSLP